MNLLIAQSVWTYLRNRGTLEYEYLQNRNLIPDQRLPGNLSSWTDLEAASRRSRSRAAWVLFPDRSRPSMTMKAPRLIVKDVGEMG